MQHFQERLIKIYKNIKVQTSFFKYKNLKSFGYCHQDSNFEREKTLGNMRKNFYWDPLKRENCSKAVKEEFFGVCKIT